MANQTATIWSCYNVTPDCPVNATIYGYVPELAANAFFLAFFGILLCANIALGYRYRTWTYTVALSLACASEVVGYIGRIMLHHNPWNNTAFIMQMCCLIIAPAFNSAAIYLTLKHLVLTFGSEWSLLKPYLYTYIFIAGDIISLVIQAIGGAMASTSRSNKAQLRNGDDLILAGISWQVCTLLCFAAMALQYAIKRNRAAQRGQKLHPESLKLYHQRSFRHFLLAIATANLAIFLRCIYRIVEFAHGWGSSVMQNEASFIACEGCLIAYAGLVQTLCHPGYCFPQMAFFRQRASHTDEIAGHYDTTEEPVMSGTREEKLVIDGIGTGKPLTGKQLALE